MSNDKFNEFCDKLEKEIIKKAIEDHNERIVELFRAPQNWGKMPEEEMSAFWSEKGKKGELLQFYLKISPKGIVEKASFFTDGCGCMVAVGSQVTLLVQGKRLKDVDKITASDIDKALHGLPKNEKHCAELAVIALNNLVKKYRKKIN